MKNATHKSWTFAQIDAFNREYKRRLTAPTAEYIAISSIPTRPTTPTETYVNRKSSNTIEEALLALVS